jgi:serine/threonine-protein kinase
MAHAPSLSRYEIVGRLATGGMAEVWLARAKGIAGFEKLVVLKTILPHLAEDPRFVQQFVNEARLAALLGHPNCVQIFDLGQEGASLFIAMEFIDGFALTRLLARARDRDVPVPEAVVARIMMDACSGLEYAHTLTDREGRPLGLVHRDVSPDNLMVTFAGLTKVVDFGVAKAASAAQLALSTAGAVKGKAGFIAPEYLQGHPVDGRADVFALGATLYRALTRKKPFPGNNDAEVSMAVLAVTPKSPLVHNPSLSPALAEVVLRALEKEPERRFQSAKAMRSAIEAAVGRVADVEGVAEYVNALWPPTDPERKALHSVSAAAPVDQGSGPLLSVVHSGDYDAVSDLDLKPIVVGTPLATGEAEAYRPPAPASATGVSAAPEPVPVRTEVVPPPVVAAALPPAAAPGSGPVFFEPTPEFEPEPSVWPKVLLLVAALGLGLGAAWYFVAGPGRGAASVTAPAPNTSPAKSPR